MSIERSLIEHCAPTLASLKVGSLFTLLFPDGKALRDDVAALNACMEQKGLRLDIVKSMGDRCLCYLHRASQLAALLEHAENAAFLRKYGYLDLTPAAVLTTLFARIKSGADFPHEIGLFLGYPLADVIGFIENKGKNCLCCGCFKAYTDECAARKLFAKFGKCTEVYKRHYAIGRTLHQLTVAA